MYYNLCTYQQVYQHILWVIMFSNTRRIKKILQDVAAIEYRIASLEDKQKLEDYENKRVGKNKEFMKQVFIQALPWLLGVSVALFTIGYKLYHTASPEQAVTIQELAQMG